MKGDIGNWRLKLKKEIDDLFSEKRKPEESKLGSRHVPRETKSSSGRRSYATNFLNKKRREGVQGENEPMPLFQKDFTKDRSVDYMPVKEEAIPTDDIRGNYERLRKEHEKLVHALEKMQQEDQQITKDLKIEDSESSDHHEVDPKYFETKLPFSPMQTGKFNDPWNNPPKEQATEIAPKDQLNTKEHSKFSPKNQFYFRKQADTTQVDNEKTQFKVNFQNSTRYNFDKRTQESGELEGSAEDLWKNTRKGNYADIRQRIEDYRDNRRNKDEYPGKLVDNPDKNEGLRGAYQEHRLHDEDRKPDYNHIRQNVEEFRRNTEGSRRNIKDYQQDSEDFRRNTKEYRQNTGDFRQNTKDYPQSDEYYRHNMEEPRRYPQMNHDYFKESPRNFEGNTGRFRETTEDFRRNPANFKQQNEEDFIDYEFTDSPQDFDRYPQYTTDKFEDVSEFRKKSVDVSSHVAEFGIKSRNQMESELNFNRNSPKQTKNAPEIRGQPENFEVRRQPENFEVRRQPDNFEVRRQPENFEVRRQPDNFEERRQPENFDEKRQPNKAKRSFEISRSSVEIAQHSLEQFKPSINVAPTRSKNLEVQVSSKKKPSLGVHKQIEEDVHILKFEDQPEEAPRFQEYEIVPTQYKTQSTDIGIPSKRIDIKKNEEVTIFPQEKASPSKYHKDNYPPYPPHYFIPPHYPMDPYMSPMYANYFNYPPYMQNPYMHMPHPMQRQNPELRRRGATPPPYEEYAYKNQYEARYTEDLRRKEERLEEEQNYTGRYDRRESEIAPKFTEKPQDFSEITPKFTEKPQDFIEITPKFTEKPQDFPEKSYKYTEQPPNATRNRHKFNEKTQNFTEQSIEDSLEEDEPVFAQAKSKTPSKAWEISLEREPVLKKPSIPRAPSKAWEIPLNEQNESNKFWKIAENINKRQAGISKESKKQKTKEELAEIRKQMMKRKPQTKVETLQTDYKPEPVQKGNSELLHRLAMGERAKVTKREMHRLTAKFNQNSEEAKEKEKEEQKKEELKKRILNAKAYDERRQNLRRMKNNN